MKPKITGYRELSEAEIAMINRVKEWLKHRAAGNTFNRSVK